MGNSSSQGSKGRPIGPCAETASNFFTSLEVARLSHRRQDAAWIAAQLQDPRTVVFPVWRGKNVFVRGAGFRPARVPADTLGALESATESLVLLGRVYGRVHFSVGLLSSDGLPPAGVRAFGQFRDLRNIAPLVDHVDGALLAYARAMTYWHHRHLFCGDCGSPTESADAGHLRVCPNPECGQQHFPRTDPAVIVIVTYRGRCLLGRKASWPAGMRSIVAGFVEPGESLEAAVVREVWEETGIRVCGVTYRSSQPWPFPSSLMLGFTARAITEDVRLDDLELEDARWMSRVEIVAALREGTLRLPSRASISFRLITEWFDSGHQAPLAELLDAL